MWRIYNILSQFNYNYSTLNNSIEFINSQTAAQKNRIKANWYALKIDILPIDIRK